MSNLFNKQLEDSNGLTFSVDVHEIVDEDQQGHWQQRYDGTGESDWIPDEIEHPNMMVISNGKYSDENGDSYTACTIRVVANVKLRKKYGKVKKVRICIHMSTLEMKDIIAKAEGNI